MNESIKEYTIFTKEDYKRYRLSKMKVPQSTGIIESINKAWETISAGYNFIIGVGNGNLMFFSVEYFNNHVLDNVNIRR